MSTATNIVDGAVLVSTMADLPSPSTTQTTAWYRAYNLFHSLSTGPKRIQWENTNTFLFSSLGYTVGLANAWRFPYAAFKCGSGGFIYAYIILIFLIGLPILYLECLLGQFTGCSPVGAFNFANIAQGVGITMVILSFILGLYFIVFMVYPIKYFFMCFESTLPWSSCTGAWGDPKQCINLTHSDKQVLPLCTTMNDTRHVDCLETPAHHFWERVILHSVEDGVRHTLHNIGTVNWDLFFVLVFCCGFVFIFSISGIKWSTKVMYFLSTIPLGILFVIMVLTVAQDGAFIGLKAFFIPDLNQLMRPIVWCEAATQVFLSFGLAIGGQILHYSHKSLDDKFIWHVNILTACDVVATFASSITFYSMLGILARILKTEVKYVVEPRPDIVFIVAPDALARLPIPNVWCMLYFLMLFFMTMSPQFIFVNVVSAAIQEQIYIFRAYGVHIRFCVCFCSFLLSISCVTQAGIYVIEFVDTYVLTVSLLWIGFFEVFFLAYVYGVRLFFLDVNIMLDCTPSLCLSIFLLFTCPCTLLVILGLAFYDVIRSFNEYPLGFSIFGWVLLSLILLQIPLWALYNFGTRVGGHNMWGGCLLPRPQWGPRDLFSKILYLAWQEHKGYPLADNTRSALNELRAQSRGLNRKEIIAANIEHDSVFVRYSGLFHKDEIETLAA